MVQFIEDVHAASLQQDWQALLADSTQGSPFLTWAWHESMLLTYGASMQPFLIAAWDGPRLIALVSLAKTSEWLGRTKYRFLGCGPRSYSMADSQDLLLAKGEEISGMRQVIAQLNQAASWDILELKEVPADSPTVELLTSEARRQGLTVSVEPVGPRYIITLPPSWEEYLTQLSKNMKSSLERKTRKLAREHDLEFAAACREHDVGTYMDHLERLHTARWRERGLPGIFAMEGAREFHRRLAHEFFKQGMLDLIGLWVNGEPVAVSYNFRYDGTLYNYASGFDAREDYGKYSLGMVLNGFMIQRAIRQGYSHIDLLRGDEHYKTHYGATPRRNVRILLFKKRRTYAGDWAARRLRRWLKPVKARMAPKFGAKRPSLP